jgi:TolB-like protein/cytochrome c-type biogenesis protein CcmH/NrfG
MLAFCSEPKITVSLFAELKRRNVVRVGLAYVVISWLLAQIAEFAFENFGAPDWVLKTLVVVFLLGLPLVLVFAWAFEMTPEGLKREEDVDRSHSITANTGKKLDYATVFGIVLILAVVVSDRFSSDEPVAENSSTESIAPEPVGEVDADAVSDKSIAVLPFVSMTASQEDEFFADGLSEEILNVLAKIEGLKVAGRTSAFYYKGRNEDLRSIAESLGVAHILEGSVRRSGNQIRVTAQLIKADDGFHLWSETYDREDGDTFVIQDEISSNVAKALQAKILGGPLPTVAADSESVEARNLFLIAQASLARRTLVDIRAARDLYAQASELDPDNPKYLAGYAQAVALQYWNFRDITPDEAITEAGAAIEQALALGTPSADTLAIAGLVEELKSSTASDPDAKAAALSYYQQAVALDANNILALQWLASIYLDINQAEEARENFEKVVELDPLNTLALTGLANAYSGLGMTEKARLHLFKVQSLFPHLGMSYRYLSFDEFAAGRLDKASFWMQRAADIDPNPLEIYANVNNYAVFGWADEALEAAELYRQSSSGTDISRLVQARLDLDFENLTIEARALFEQTGDADFAVLSAWAESVSGHCENTVTILERQFPSLKGEVIEYLDGRDLINAVLLAHCNKEIGRGEESERLTGALFASDLISDEALIVRPGLKLVRVGLHAVAGDDDSAIYELKRIDPNNAPVAISILSLPVDDLPIFASLTDKEPFRKFASNQRYRIAQQARMLASGETAQEIQAQIEMAGYTLGDWR